MYTLSEQQIDFIVNDIKNRGVEIEDLQLNLLDHICCIIECEFEMDENFENFYEKTISKFFKKELKEIEEETILLLTFKNYYIMKKTMIISGVLSVILLITGSFFKIMYWPGAGPLLVLGIAIVSFLFLPFMFLLKSKDVSTKHDKLLVAIGSLIGISLCLSTLFSIMHWPGSTILWLATITLSGLVFIPMYFFNGIRKPEMKINTIVISVLLVSATTLVFMMVNIRPAKEQTRIKICSYIQSEDLLKKMQHNFNQNNSGKNELADDINSTTEQIKELIWENTIGQPTIPKDFEKENIIVIERDLGVAFRQEGRGIVLFSHLKETVNKYNALKMNREDKVPIDLFQVDKIGLYSNFVVLNYLVQMQMYLATSESRLTAAK